MKQTAASALDMLASYCRPFLSLVAVLAVAPGLLAANLYMTADDVFGSSSFHSAGNWNNLAAPSAGNDYHNATFLLRTPADGASYAFAGDSLTITGTGLSAVVGNQAFMYKGWGAAATITVNNLTIDGAQLRHGSGDSDLFNLAGDLAIGVNGATMQAQGVMNISSIVSGSGPIRILDAGNDFVGRTVTFANPANTYHGSIELFSARSRFALANAATLNFHIGGSGLNNSIFGSGIATLNGVFNFDLSGAGTAIGESWTIVDNATVNEMFGGTFRVAGFSDLGGDLWGRSENGADYVFSEATGMLTVVPEPGSGALILAALGLLGRRFRKA